MLTIGSRFNGPPGSGNGGFSSGLVASLLPDASGVEVTLRTPPPLDTPLDVVREGDRVLVSAAGTPVAEARLASVEGVDPGTPIPFAAAVEASERYPGFVEHPYPTCFVCGPDRAEADGLRLFPGAVDDLSRRVAAPWTPDPSLADDAGSVHRAMLWAALDCPSWYGHAAFEEWEGRPLLGRLTVEIRSLPRAGEPCVVAGWSLGRDGRKVHAASVVWGADGTVHGVARSTWILVDQPSG